MTDETGDDVPMTGPMDESPQEEPTPDAPTQGGPTQEGPTQGGPPTADWTSPPAWGSSSWGSAPAGWPPPPSTPPSAPMAPPTGPVTPPAASWGYGYGGAWSPPPQPNPPQAARRVVAAIAVAILVLVSGAVGAAISAAVHNNSTSPSVTGAPFTPDNGAGSGTTPGSTSGIASKVSPALVNIYTTIDTGVGRGEAAGTGMVITSSGEVLTNNHVIADSTTVRVELVENGETHTAKVLGYDVKDDVALLKIDGVSGLNTVSFADASKVVIGDAVVAIGNAGGRGGTPTVSSGSVTALDQKVTAGDQGSGNSETLSGMIEISAPIEPGDSGGPLVNSKGQVIGMNTAAATSDRFSGQVTSSTAFAIPINRAVQLAREIEAGRDSANVHIGERGLLGVRVRDIAAQLTCTSVPTNSGALIAGVNSGSPADSAGLATCDVIVSVAGKSIATTSDLNAAMFPYHPGEKVSIGWVDQSGHRQDASLQLVPGPPS